jgi:hypothetical protein
MELRIVRNFRFGLPGPIQCKPNRHPWIGDRAHVGTVPPKLGIDKLFGARESYVEFLPP